MPIIDDLKTLVRSRGSCDEGSTEAQHLNSPGLVQMQYDSFLRSTSIPLAASVPFHTSKRNSINLFDNHHSMHWWAPLYTITHDRNSPINMVPLMRSIFRRRKKWPNSCFLSVNKLSDESLVGTLNKKLSSYYSTSSKLLTFCIFPFNRQASSLTRKIYPTFSDRVLVATEVDEYVLEHCYTKVEEEVSCDEAEVSCDEAEVSCDEDEVSCDEAEVYCENTLFAIVTLEQSLSECSTAVVANLVRNANFLCSPQADSHDDSYSLGDIISQLVELHETLYIRAETASVKNEYAYLRLTDDASDTSATAFSLLETDLAALYYCAASRIDKATRKRLSIRRQNAGADAFLATMLCTEFSAYYSYTTRLVSEDSFIVHENAELHSITDGSESSCAEVSVRSLKSFIRNTSSTYSIDTNGSLDHYILSTDTSCFLFNEDTESISTGDADSYNTYPLEETAFSTTTESADLHDHSNISEPSQPLDPLFSPETESGSPTSISELALLELSRKTEADFFSQLSIEVPAPSVDSTIPTEYVDLNINLNTEYLDYRTLYSEFLQDGGSFTMNSLYDKYIALYYHPDSFEDHSSCKKLYPSLALLIPFFAYRTSHSIFSAPSYTLLDDLFFSFIDYFFSSTFLGLQSSRHSAFYLNSNLLNTTYSYLFKFLVTNILPDMPFDTYSQISKFLQELNYPAPVPSNIHTQQTIDCRTIKSLQSPSSVLIWLSIVTFYRSRVSSSDSWKDVISHLPSVPYISSLRKYYGDNRASQFSQSRTPSQMADLLNTIPEDLVLYNRPSQIKTKVVKVSNVDTKFRTFKYRNPLYASRKQFNSAPVSTFSARLQTTTAKKKPVASTIFKTTFLSSRLYIKKKKNYESRKLKSLKYKSVKSNTNSFFLGQSIKYRDLKWLYINFVRTRVVLNRYPYRSTVGLLSNSLNRTELDLSVMRYNTQSLPNSKLQQITSKPVVLNVAHKPTSSSILSRVWNSFAKSKAWHALKLWNSKLRSVKSLAVSHKRIPTASRANEFSWSSFLFRFIPSISRNSLAATIKKFSTVIASFSTIRKKQVFNSITYTTEWKKKLVFRTLSGIRGKVFRWNKKKITPPVSDASPNKHKRKRHKQKPYFISYTTPFKDLLPHKSLWQGIAVRYNKVWTSHKFVKNKKNVRFKANDIFEEEPQSTSFINTRMATLLFKRTRRNFFLIFSYFFKNSPGLNRIIYYQTTGCLGFRKKLKVIAKATDDLTTHFLNKFEYLCKDYTLKYLSILINGSTRNLRKMFSRILGKARYSVFLYRRARRAFIEKENRKRMAAAYKEFLSNYNSDTGAPNSSQNPSLATNIATKGSLNSSTKKSLKHFQKAQTKKTKYWKDWLANKQGARTPSPINIFSFLGLNTQLVGGNSDAEAGRLSSHQSRLLQNLSSSTTGHNHMQTNRTNNLNVVRMNKMKVHRKLLSKTPNFFTKRPSSNGSDRFVHPKQSTSKDLISDMNPSNPSNIAHCRFGSKNYILATKTKLNPDRAYFLRPKLDKVRSVNSKCSKNKNLQIKRPLNPGSACLKKNQTRALPNLESAKSETSTEALDPEELQNSESWSSHFRKPSFFKKVVATKIQKPHNSQIRKYKVQSSDEVDSSKSYTKSHSYENLKKKDFYKKPRFKESNSVLPNAKSSTFVKNNNPVSKPRPNRALLQKTLKDRLLTPKNMFLPSSVLKFRWAPRFLFFIDKTSFPFNGCRRSRHYHIW